MRKKNIYILGDTHKINFVPLLAQHELKDFVLIGVGDHGEIGNQYESLHDIELLARYCHENDGQILLTRGNHSDPSWFNFEHWANSYISVMFVPDNELAEINGKKVLFSGGAVSVDRQFNTLGIDYFSNERFSPKPVSQDIDFLITHTSHLSHGFSNIQHLFAKDVELKQDLLDEQELMREFVNSVNPKIAHFWGHFHHSVIDYSNGRLNRCLDIDEIYDATHLFNF